MILYYQVDPEAWWSEQSGESQLQFSSNSYIIWEPMQGWTEPHRLHQMGTAEKLECISDSSAGSWEQRHC